MGGLKMNKINVAIADDNQRTVEMMTELLEQESDIEVIASADDGEEALRIIKEKQPDVVLLDIIIPKLDGIGVLERLQTEDLSKRPIIIMVSAMGQENVCEEAMELGASYFILKPFDLRTIIKQIKQAKIKQQIPERPFVSVPEKIHGLTEQIIREAIARTKEARTHILHDVMNPVIPAARDHVGEFAPKISQYTIDPEKISEVIGKQGKTINGIIDETGVKIDIDESGRIDILSEDQAMIDKAISIIKSIVEPLNVGDIYEGEVVRIMNFGAFVQLAPNKDGLIHISKLSKERVEKVEDVVNIGDKVKVKVLEIDKMGRINLALREIIK